MLGPEPAVQDTRHRHHAMADVPALITLQGPSSHARCPRPPRPAPTAPARALCPGGPSQRP
eukprot:1246850-Rhodomonas_salina.3